MITGTKHGNCCPVVLMFCTFWIRIVGVKKKKKKEYRIVLKSLQEGHEFANCLFVSTISWS